MTHDFAIVTTSLGDAEAARTMARALVEARLAACVQVMPIRSFYRWEGAIEESAEHMLVCKIKATDFAQVRAEIARLHSYDVPEILMTPIIEGHAPYLAWLEDAVRR